MANTYSENRQQKNEMSGSFKAETTKVSNYIMTAVINNKICIPFSHQPNFSFRFFQNKDTDV